MDFNFISEFWQYFACRIDVPKDLEFWHRVYELWIFNCSGIQKSVKFVNFKLFCFYVYRAVAVRFRYGVLMEEIFI